jgi:lipopolysaccharide export LptBFGC system permease protein LptF
MSIFEILMLVCFGAAWPFSIYKSYTSRQTAGKSGLFLIIVLVGYAAGIIHKLLYSFDPVIYLYGLNALMVAVDLVLFTRNSRTSGTDANHRSRSS